MNRSSGMKRRNYIVLGIVFLTLLYLPVQHMLAVEGLMTWRKQDTMDTSFNIIRNKAGDDDILLELEVENSGNYNLTYYLEDGRETSIDLIQSYDAVAVQYHVYENDGLGGFTDITQTLASTSYLEMDYSLTVPDWVYDAGITVGASGGLEYSIARSASSKYPGVAFEVNNKKVLIKWDFQDNKIYVRINDYEYGKIMPVTFTTPTSGSQSIKILKQLEDFNIIPTHLKSDGAGNYEVVPIVLPNSTGDKPGSRPGLQVSFRQPKELNTTTWQYEYSTTDMDDITAIFEFEDIGTGDYMDFNIKLMNDGDQFIYDADSEAAGINDNIVFLYDHATYTYTINIVADKSALEDQEEFLQWSELAPSSIYDVNVGFQVDLTSTNFDDYEFVNYQPQSKFANTYMAYELKRSNVEEAYLDITPFNAGASEEIEYVILYSKVIKTTLDTSEDLWLKNYHTTESEDDEIFIPVPFRSTSSQDAYQIVVNFAGQELYSQVLNYKAVLDTNVPPTTPTIEEIDNLFVVPPLVDGATDPLKVQLDMVWDAPTNKDIKALDAIFEDDNADPTDDHLYYEISVNELPTDYPANPFEVIKIFEVYLDGGEYKLRLVEPTPGIETPSSIVNYIDGYNVTDELLRMEKITLFAEGSWMNRLDTVIDEDLDTYTITDSGDDIYVEFPGVNYIRVRAITMKDGQIAYSSKSVPVSISLNLNIFDIPVVDTMEYTPIYGTESDNSAGVTLTWHSVDITNYENNMLEPIDRTIDNIVYTFYIAEDKGSLLPLDGDDDNYYEVFMDNANLMQLDEADVSHLRDGDVVYFERYASKSLNTEISLALQGLDVNRDYVVRVVTKLTIDDLPSIGNDLEWRRSDPSSVLAVTVPKIPDGPSGTDVYPLAPELFSADYTDDSQILATLSWTMPEEMSFDNDMNGFEIIAIEDRSLPPDLYSKDLGLLEVVEDDVFATNVVEAFRIYVHEGVTYLKKYNFDTQLFEDKDLSLISIADNDFQMIDDANAPNRVNYYYVRTVRMKDEDVEAASPWVMDTLTTAPVKGPINLAVDYVTDYSYEPKEEFIIHFDAPIPDLNQIGTDYILEIHVKGEDDTDYSTTTYPSIYLGSDDEGATGYKRLYYRITDLTPGKTYSIKVRIEDRTQPQETLPDGSLAYPTSPFSELVVSRTEFDQETYDKENKYFEYLNYYVTKAEELKYLPYFNITSSVSEKAFKYRESYAAGLINKSSNSEWLLVSGDADIDTYYIPSNSLELINDRNVTVVLENKDHLVGIRPDSIGMDITDEITDMLEAIDEYNSTNEDYYLRIKVYSGTYNSKVAGKTPSSELVQVELAVVGSRKMEENMDALMVASLDSVIEANKSELIEKLEEELISGINDPILLSIVEEMVAEVKSEYLGQASIIFKGYLDTSPTSISSVEKSMYIALKPDDSSSHEMYTKNYGSFVGVTSTYFNSRFYTETKTLNPFLLVPSSSSSSLTENYGSDAVNVINTYNLTTVFSSYDLSNPSEKIDKYQWVSAVARLLGATSGTDTVSYLTGKGLTATSLNLYQGVTYEEGLYLMVQAYAYRHNTPLDRVVVTNYNIINDINDVTLNYRLPLIRGANLGIFDTNGGWIYPSHTMTMDEGMELLTTLHLGLN